MEPLMFIAAAAAALTGIFVVGRKMLDISRGIVAVHTIIRRELTPNNGSSMKDQLNRAAEQAATGARRADDAVEQTKQTRTLLTESIAAMDAVRQEVERISRRVGSLAADQAEIAANSDREHAEMWETLAEAGFDRRRRSTRSHDDDGADGSV